MSTDFPGVGRRYLVDFVAFRVELFFASSSSMTYTAIASDGTRGGSETVSIQIVPIRDGLFLVTWQEHDKTTVVHVEDFDENKIITNITNPDLSFEQHTGNFKEVPSGTSTQLSYQRDVRPLFRDRDAACMTPRHVPLLDPVWMCDPTNAARVYERLADQTMPKDGPWPPERIALFKGWIDQGCNP